jgi:hypothetical protein
MANIAINRRSFLVVAAQAPAHLRVPRLGEAVHGLDRSVAGLAGELGADVRRVIEVGEIRDPKHPDPGNGAAVIEIISQLGDFRLAGRDDAVAAQTALD